MPAGETQEGFVARWTRFWFAPSDPIAFKTMRTLTGGLVALWLLSLIGSQTALFGAQGWLDLRGYAVGREQRLMDAAGVAMPVQGWADPLRLDSRLVIPEWSPLYWATSPALVHAFYFGGIAAAALFALGIAPRITGVLNWLTVATFTANPILSSYGGESLLLMISFYLMVGQLLIGAEAGKALTPGFWLGNEAPEKSAAANFALRLIQVHFAILVTATAFCKLQTYYWWEGIGLWFLYRPADQLTYEQVTELRGSPSSVRLEFGLLGLLGYATIAWQLCFPFYAWKKPAVVGGGGILGLLGCWFLYRLPMFGPTFLLACFAFIPACGWRTAIGRIVKRGQSTS